MRRLAAILLATVLTPGLVQAQAESRMHTVVRGETLWGLAERFCGDPFQWPDIYRANQARIADPHWIQPGQQLQIPCAGPGGDQGRVTEIQVQTPDPGRVQPPAEEPVVDERRRRSVFYRDLSASVSPIDQQAYAVMSRDHVWAASWFQYGIDADPRGVGRVGELLADEHTRTAMPYGNVRVEATGTMPSVGDALQIYRSVREYEETGIVIRPTGVLSVTAVADGAFEGVVLKAYDRVRVGDFVGPAPSYSVREGQHASEVDSSATAAIITFDPFNAIRQIGDIAILDRGSTAGVAVGDEYVLELGEGGGFDGVEVGRLQVLRVDDETASARIVEIDERAFEAGQTVRLSRKMR